MKKTSGRRDYYEEKWVREVRKRERNEGKRDYYEERGRREIE
jgi:hypothetical protein